MIKERHNPMSLEEERKLFEKLEILKMYSSKIEEEPEYQVTVNRLYEANELMMYKIASKFSLGRGGAISRDDLVCASYDALLTALNRFDYKREIRFSTFLYRAVYDCMRRYLQKHGRAVSVPIRIQERYSKIQSTESILRNELGRDPFEEELSHRTGFSVDDIREAKLFMSPMVNLDNNVEDSLKSYLETIVDPTSVALS